MRARRARSSRRLVVVVPALAPEEAAVRRGLIGGWRPGGAPSGSMLELALKVLGELRDGGVIEEFGEIDEPGEIAIDVLVDFDELQGTCADLEQVVVHLDALSRQGGRSEERRVGK